MTDRLHELLPGLHTVVKWAARHNPDALEMPAGEGLRSCADILGIALSKGDPAVPAVAAVAAEIRRRHGDEYD